MKHEKILKREDGTRVKISVSVNMSLYYELRVNYWVSVCEPKKRTFCEVNPESYATREEIEQTAVELWEKLKPTFETMERYVSWPPK